MDKRTPHYSLEVVKKLIQRNKFGITRTAMALAYDEFGLFPGDILKVVLNLTVKDFYKSMTTYSDHRIWQDVYRPLINRTRAYVKLNIVNDCVIVIQFKRK